MKADIALETLKFIAHGVHPFSRQKMRKDHFFNEPEVLEAVNICINLVAQNLSKKTYLTQQDKMLINIVNGKARNHGFPWSNVDTKKLISEYIAGRAASTLSRELGRSRGAIVSHLELKGVTIR
ncbi:hypothetical protein [Shewanella sp. 6_MG-2023]|uniref:hypothetical protein n=1 Tax=Shewanella sp. 6_MG-2023 TaxID=3062660 RepID=UPI0026E136EA|nr:hypothetical protein [Shewanella sp. 6_MG-2023]